MEKIKNDLESKLNSTERDHEELKEQFRKACETGVILKEQLTRVENELQETKDEV